MSILNEFPHIGSGFKDAKRGVQPYVVEGLGEIHLEPDRSLTSHFARHKASVGIATNNGRWEWLPLGVVVYPWFIKNLSRYENAGWLKIVMLIFLTAWWSPLASLGKASPRDTVYQLGQAALVTFTIFLTQPLYESGWQTRKRLKSL